MPKSSKLHIEHVAQIFKTSSDIKNSIAGNETLLNSIVAMTDTISESIVNGGKLLLCGNGGSAADAQHLAAELLVRLRADVDRKGLPAIALAMDTSTFTACGNDFSYEHLYQRMVNVLGKSEDVLLGITTSGNSENINLALRAAKDKGMTTFGFLGGTGGNALSLCDIAFVVPSDVTARIQESHITAGHALLELVENNLLQRGFI